MINSDIAGTGLGLAITKALVDMMKGKISVISKKDEGSVFEVLIPQGIGNERDTESEVKINYSNQSHNDDIWKDVPEVVISDN